MAVPLGFRREHARLSQGKARKRPRKGPVDLSGLEIEAI